MARNLDKPRTLDVIIEDQIGFEALLLSDETLKGLKDSGFTHPSPIQLKSIPIVKSGKSIYFE